MTVDYRSMVYRLQEIVWESVPRGSTVAVISKGDPDLVLFDGRGGWHYPQTPTGGYLGHHPASGPEAVAHLESVRQRGAQFLLVPATSSWWLNHYTDLRMHLEMEGHVLRSEDGIGVLYALSKAATLGETARSAAQLQLRELVTALLPEGCTVVAVGAAYPALLATAGLEVVEFPDTSQDATGQAAIRELDALRNTADFLVIPAAGARPVDNTPGLHEHLRANLTPVTDQQHVGALFELAPVPGAAEKARR